MDFSDVVGIVSRWLHVSSAITLVGAAAFAAGPLARSGQLRVFTGFRTAAIAAVVLLLATGLYNLLAKTVVPPGYHAMFGIKVLLALHVFAVSIIASGASMDDARRKRLLGGMASSGFVIVLISAYLRWLSR
jgi:hypothetical protein